MKAWAKLKAMTRMVFSRSGAGAFFNMGNSRRIDFAAEVGDGLEHNVLMSPLLWVSRTFPEAALAVRKDMPDGKREVNFQHPMVRLVRRPNKFYSASALWMATIISYFTDGNGYWAKIRGKGNRVAELWYLPHWQITPKGDESVFISHYEYRADGVPMQRIDAEDVVHFRYGLDPENPRKGYGLLKAIRVALFTDNEAQSMVAWLLKNKGIPGIIISPDPSVVLSPEDETAVKDYIDDSFSGAGRGKPLVLGGSTKVQQMGFNPEELNLGKTHNVSEERVCAAIGMPAAVVGFATDTTKVGATLKELVKLAWTGCIIPTQRAFAEELERSLLPDFDKDENLVVYFDTSEVEALQANKLEAAQAAEVEIAAGITTRGEARRKLGHEVKPGDDVFYIPFNAIVTPRSYIEPAPAAAAAAPAAPANPFPGKSVKGHARLTAIQAQILRASDHARKRFEPKLKVRMMEFFASYGAAIEKAWNQVGKAADDELRVDAVFSRIDLPRFKSELRGIYASHYVAVYNDQRGTLAGLGIGVDLPDTAQLEILARGGSQAGLVDLTEAGKARAIKIIADAREQGLGVAETARLLRDAIPAGPFTETSIRAQLIARTETRIAQTTSALMSYRNAAGIDQVMMIDARLGETDAECEAVNGVTASFDEAQGLLDDEHPNGTRDIVPVFTEE